MCLTESTKSVVAQLKSIKPVRPRQLVTTEIKGPIPISALGNKYILVVIDHFTKWVENQEVKSVADFLVVVMVTYKCYRY